MHDYILVSRLGPLPCTGVSGGSTGLLPHGRGALLSSYLLLTPAEEAQWLVSPHQCLTTTIPVVVIKPQFA
jgi:hypothetical protein